MARLHQFRIALLARIADPQQPDSFKGRGFSSDDRMWLEVRGYITLNTYNHTDTGGKHYVLTPKGVAHLLEHATSGLNVR